MTTTSGRLFVLAAAGLAGSLLMSGVAVASTQNLDNFNKINVPDDSPAGVASSVTMDSAGTVTEVEITLFNVSHQYPRDLDIELVGPHGQAVLLMSDSCGPGPTGITSTTFSFDDDATATLGTTGATCAAGTYAPTDNADPGVPSDDDPMPVAVTGTTLSVFDGTDAKGVWTVWAVDDGFGTSGTIDTGFRLTLTTTPPPPDKTPPQTVIDAKPSDSDKSHVKLRFSASEAGSHFECKVDKQSWAACSSPFKVRHLSVGKHKVRVRAIDAAGNVDASPAKASWRRTAS